MNVIQWLPITDEKGHHKQDRKGNLLWRPTVKIATEEDGLPGGKAATVNSKLKPGKPSTSKIR